MIVSFFGHRDEYNLPLIKIESIITNLIEKENATTFYIGNNGAFDATVTKMLADIKSKYPYIECITVLAYMPTERAMPPFKDAQTLFPEEAAKALPRYAILARNQWMIKSSDVVVTYVTHDWGGAAKSKNLALKKGKRIIEINDI